MDYVISASYGNDSMAMMRWAYERKSQRRRHGVRWTAGLERW